jgi:hypothetical protein
MDEKRRSFIYTALRKYTVTIEYKEIPDNQYIYKKMCQCSAYLTEVGKISLEVRKAYSDSEKRFRAENQNLRILRNQTLTTNDRVKKLPTGREREAAVDDLLEANVIEVENLETEMRALKELKDAVKEHINIIKNSHMTAKDLLKAYDVPVSKLNLGSYDDPEVADLHRTLAEVDRLEQEEFGNDTESSVNEDNEDEFDGGEASYEEEENVGDEFDDIETSLKEKDGLSEITESLINDTDIVKESEESLDGSEIQVLTDQGDSKESEIQVLLDSNDETDSSPSEVSEMAGGNSNPTESSGDQLDDDLGEISSFLTEDSFVSGLEEDSEDSESDREEKEESKEEEIDNKDDIDLSDVSISDDESSDGKKEKELPSVQIDLSDIGINLDVGDDSESIPSENTSDDIPDAEVSEESSKSEPILEEDTGESDGSDDINDLDLEDILAGMNIGDG